MTKDTIQSVVTKHLKAAIEDLDDGPIDLSKSMKELGANSLDIVEVVSSSMRELKLKVPRAELAKLANIGALIDLLFTVSQQNKAA